MSSVTCQISISLDGFVAGPNQSLDHPIGVGGMRLHQWLFDTVSWREQHWQAGGARNADSEVLDEVVQNVGAYIMGRKMFGGGDGPWNKTWRGWWGEEPPYHVPVFVLTHHAREPLSMRGGTTFTFVTTGTSRRSSKPGRPPAERTSPSPAARTPCSNTSPPGCSTSSTCTSCR